MIDRKISTKLITWIVLTSMILTFFSLIFYFNQEYKQKLNEFNSYLSSIKTDKEKILVLSIWHLDKEAIKEILVDIVDNKKIGYASIKLSTSKVYERGNKKFKNVLEKKFVLRKKANGHIYIIGELTVQGNLNYINEIIIKSIMNLIFYELFKVFLMSIIIIFLIRKLFIDDLEKLAKFSSNVHLENLNEELFFDKMNKEEKNFNELETVINSFNKMKKNLYYEIQKSNKIKNELVSFRHAVEKSYNSIVITDTRRRIIYVNSFFEKITGYSKEEVIGKNPNILKPQNSEALYYKNMNDTLNRGEIWQGELVNIKKNGTTFYEQASIIPIFQDEILTNYLAIKLDITDYKEAAFKINKLNLQLENKVQARTKQLEEKNVQLTKTEKLAIESRKEAETANREKSMLLANISHELKTPLNGILGLVYLSKLKTDDTKLIKNLDNINTYSETLLRMISDLLDTAKMDAKKVQIIDASFDFIKLLKSIKQIYVVESKKKNIKFIFEYDKNIPNMLYGDSIRIHQVITNLINNALKFTAQENGFVKVDISMLDKNEKIINLLFTVSDNGIGIKADDFKNIFNPFYQTKESLNYYAGGSGLGLNICKKIIEQMNGTISLQSKLNGGTIFSISVPLQIDKKLDKQDNKNQIKKLVSNNDSLVLVVDDNNINLEVIEEILKSININCKMAKNGVEALALVEKFKFDLVLTDIKMPIMDGCELSKELRRKFTMTELPIIIISANNEDSFSQCTDKCSVNDYIGKPINPVKFLDKLSKYISFKPNEIINIRTSNTDDILDIPDALCRFINNEKLYKNALKGFYSDINNSMEKIDKFINRKNENELLDYLHTLKGVSGNLSAKKFYKVTKDFHDAVKYAKPYKKIYIEYKNKVIELKEVISEYIKKELESVQISTENEVDLKEKKEKLICLLEFTKIYSTKAVTYFDKLPNEIKGDKLFSDIYLDITAYKFNEASLKIEKFLEENP